MIVEVTGVSSAGKSTLLTAVQGRRIEPATGRRRRAKMILRAANGYVRSPRTGWSTGRALVWAHRQSMIGRRQDRWIGTFNAWQAFGLLSAARRIDRNPGEQDSPLFLDTGPVHTVYNFFVDPDTPPDLDAVAEYLDRIPLADQTLQVVADREAVIDRTLGRTNRRTRGMGVAEAARFHDHAVACFEVAATHPRLAGRWEVLRSDSDAGDLVFHSGGGQDRSTT